MKIISWNVNGLRARIKDGTFADLISEYDPDVLLLQEVRATYDQLPNWFYNLENEDYWIQLDPHSRKGYAGVMSITKKNLSPSSAARFEPEDIFKGRQLTTLAGHTSILSLYSPNSGATLGNLSPRNKFDLNLRMQLIEHGVENFPDIICGDLNVAPTELDNKCRSVKAGVSQIERDNFQYLLDNMDYNYVDAWRYINGDKQEMTWYSNFDKEKKCGMRIDHFLVREEYKENIKDCYIIQTDRQDHQPIVLEYENNY